MGCHLWGHTESDTTKVTWRQQQQRECEMMPPFWKLVRQFLKMSNMESPCDSVLTLPHINPRKENMSMEILVHECS